MLSKEVKMLDKFITNIMEVNTLVGGNEIRISSKNDKTNYGIMVNTLVVNGSSKTTIPEIDQTFGITAIKLVNQIISNKSIKESGTFEIVKEFNQFTNKEQITSLKISGGAISANIRLAGEDVLQKVPVANSSITWSVIAKDIDGKTIASLMKNIEILANNDEYFSVDINDKDMIFSSGKKGQNLLAVKGEFETDSNGYTGSSKYLCKDFLAGLKVASKYDKITLRICNMGLINILTENDFITVDMYLRGASNNAA